MEYIEDIWILIAADPTQSVQLKCPANYVGEKSCRLKTANIEHNPHLAQLLLDHGDHEACALCGGSLHSDVKANAIDCGIAGGIEQRAGFFGIVIVSRDIAVIGPALRGKHAVGRLRPSTPEILNHGTSIDGVGDGLPDAHIFQDGIAQVEAEVLNLCAGGVFDGDKRLALESVNGIGCERVDG